MTTEIQYGLLALIALSALAAIGVSILIARRQDISKAARRAFLLSNASLILCLAAAVAGISIYSSRHDAGLLLEALAVVFLVIKFVFVRKFAHLIRQEHPRMRSRAMPQAGNKI